MKFDNKERYKPIPKTITQSAELILKLEDDWLFYRDKEKYNKRWQDRCNDCPAPCCTFSMSGHRYKYENDGKDISNEQYFFDHEFVIIHSVDLTEDDKGLNPVLGDEHDNINLCPLNIYGKCLIYEDRPKICRIWKCMMGQKNKIGVERNYV